MRKEQYYNSNEISLKRYFGGEATGFTPWLKKNIEILQDILKQKNVEVYRREAQVKDFYIDLLLRNKTELIVVENQYGETDHAHLGKCVLYSSLVKAKKAVWIAEEINSNYLNTQNNLNIDLIVCSFRVEKYSDDMHLLKVYSYSTNGQDIYCYLLNKDKKVVKRIK